MGCWNGTCGISNLPIMSGDKVVLFVLQKEKFGKNNSGGFCYPFDQFYPISIPVYGEYNDYGGIENISKNGQVVFDHLISQKLTTIKKEWDRQDLTEGPADIEDLLNNYIERGVYEDIGFMMIRQDIFDELMSANLIGRQKYVAGAKEYIAAYQEKAQELVNMKEVLEQISPDDEPARQKVVQKILSRIESDLEGSYSLRRSYGSQNCFLWSMDSVQGGWYHIRDLAIKIPTEENDDLMESIVDLIMVDQWLYSLRKFWSIQCGAGSQAEEYDMHIVLSKKILSLSQAGKNAYQEFYE